MQARLNELRRRLGATALIGYIADALYERGQLGEILDDVTKLVAPQDETDAQARRAYQQYVANHPTVHESRFPPWDELATEARDLWLGAVRRQNEMMAAHLSAQRSSEGQMV
jgi:hypothetical protein